jgi:hypothetical protein
MTLGRKDVTVTRTNRGADIFRLAGLFGDDNLIRHQGLVWWTGFEHPERIVNYPPTASHPPTGLRQGGKTVEKRHRVIRRAGAVVEAAFSISANLRWRELDGTVGSGRSGYGLERWPVQQRPAGWSRLQPR